MKYPRNSRANFDDYIEIAGIVKDNNKMSKYIKHKYARMKDVIGNKIADFDEFVSPFISEFFETPLSVFIYPLRFVFNTRLSKK